MISSIFKMMQQAFRIIGFIICCVSSSFANPVPKCFMYGANGQVAVEALNATLNEVAATSFEEMLPGGTWTLSAGGINTMAGVRSFTGSKYYTLSSGNITRSFSPAPGKTMVVSYWSRSGGQTVNSAVGTTGRSVQIDGFTWTQYRHTITNPTSITVSGTGIIDELRLHPLDSDIITYTYQKDVGISSRCDAQGRANYMEYDAFNRVVVERDLDFRVTKRYCYGRKGEQHDCTGTIYTNEVREVTLDRTDCPTGLTAGTVTYTVPAGTYYSYESQTVANQMADDDIEANKVAFANINGSCNLTFQSIDYSGIYYSQQCTWPSSPNPIFVSVPQGQFTSTISQQDANQQAHNYALQYANTNGTCANLADLYYYNNSWGYISISLENLTTYEQYYFEIYSSGSGILGSVPAGNYTVTINSSNYITASAGCDLGNSGYAITLSPVQFDSNCNQIYISQ